MNRGAAWRSSAAWRTYVGGAIWAGALALSGGVEPRAIDAVLAVRTDVVGVLAVLAALIAGMNFFPAAWRSVLRARLDMNVLMSIAIVAAVAIGEPVEAATLAVLFSFAELLERAAVQRGRQAISRLLELAPDEAEVVLASGATEMRPVASLGLGETVRVRPGGRIAADGSVIAGESSVNEATITGESLPVHKTVGAKVFAGTINFDGTLDVAVQAVAGQRTLDRIVSAVREAEARRAPIAQLVDRFSRVYTPIVTLLAVLVAVGPALLGVPDPHAWFLRGVTLLVIACPCALVIATPVTVVSALTSAARHGVLVKGGVHLEALAGIRTLAMDKTGTLTRGELTVRAFEVRPPTEARALLASLAALESRSEHPTAHAIVRYARAEGVEPAREVEAFEAVPGRGVQGRVAGVELVAGTERLVGDAASRGWSPTGMAGATVLVASAGGALGRLTLTDTVRSESPAVVAALHALGIRPIVMLTGDTEVAAAAVGAAAGVDEVRARLLPDDKVRAVRELAERPGGVAMLGDGVNDAPALAAATVGIAMGAAGAPATIETADVALMRDDLRALPYALGLSRRTMRMVRFNVASALIVKALLAVGTVAGVVSLSVAVLVGDVGGTVLVTLNALRLARHPGPEQPG